MPTKSCTDSKTKESKIRLELLYKTNDTERSAPYNGNNNCVKKTDVGRTDYKQTGCGDGPLKASRTARKMKEKYFPVGCNEFQDSYHSVNGFYESDEEQTQTNTGEIIKFQSNHAAQDISNFKQKSLPRGNTTTFTCCVEMLHASVM